MCVNPIAKPLHTSYLLWVPKLLADKRALLVDWLERNAWRRNGTLSTKSCQKSVGCEEAVKFDSSKKRAELVCEAALQNIPRARCCYGEDLRIPGCAKIGCLQASKSYGRHEEVKETRGLNVRNWEGGW